MKYYVIVFTLGLLLGLFYSFMYRTLFVVPVQPSVSKKSVVEVKKEVAQQDLTNSVTFLGRVAEPLEIMATASTAT